jgi:hypothetical protein
LPTQGTLLRGVTRIAYRKAAYVEEDAVNAYRRFFEIPRERGEYTRLVFFYFLFF